MLLLLRIRCLCIQMPKVRQNTEDTLHQRALKDLSRRPLRRNPTVHQHNLVRMARNHAEIMRDEEDREILLCPQIGNDLIEQ